MNLLRPTTYHRDRSIWWFVGVWSLFAMIFIMWWGTVIYIAHHFIAKYW